TDLRYARPEASRMQERMRRHVQSSEGPPPPVPKPRGPVRRPSQAMLRSEAPAGASEHDAGDAVDHAKSATGHPLPDHLRERFESSLGADLSAVRVHTGSASAEASSAVGARAYTVGRDVHFAEGQYRPDDPVGVRLLAHE